MIAMVMSIAVLSFLGGHFVAHRQARLRAFCLRRYSLVEGMGMQPRPGGQWVKYREATGGVE